MQPTKSVLIGVFDTGHGGELVAERLKVDFPNAVFVTADDVAHAPYGSRSNNEVKQLAMKAIRPLVDRGCNPIIIACNTATTIAIDHLRANLPQIDFVGFEPMIKPAAESTRTGAIAILATPATLASQRYRELKASYADGIKVVEPDCASWAMEIQAGKMPSSLPSVCQAMIDSNCDNVVLACTHYLAIESQLAGALLGVNIMEPTAAVSRQIRTLIEAR